jgi:ribose transport system ATP-binding protein
VRLAGHAPLDLTLAQGEVVGITGLPGTGFEELPHLLGGSRRGAGTIVTPRGTVDLARTTVTQCLEAGIALVPERRITDGLAIEMSVRDNLALPTIRRRGRPWLVRRDWQERLAAGAIHRWGIRSPGPGALVRELSGGNQQKVLFAKWLSVEPSLLVLHEPTQAVDVGARADLLRTIGETAAAGAGVLLVSTEPSDLVETCDRVLVLHPGRPPHELRTSDPDDVLEAIYGVPATPSSSLENETGALHV